ncbi:MAG TPA: tetratricopeptide repeat protein, partial [Candidatus Wallbacteria bacterium]|nr:tetratricopeptide repeat protein [Candidatus Wallbacteria bacterium]
MHKEFVLIFFIVIIAVTQVAFKGTVFAASSETQTLIDKAEKLINEGDYQEAKRTYLKAIAADPKNTQCRNNLGAMFVVLGDLEKALEQFEAILKINPEYSNAYENIGLIMSRKGDYERAAKMLKMSLSLNPDS